MNSLVVVVSYWNSTSNHNLIGNYNTAPSVVSYWNSTSNHNFGWNANLPIVLYLIEILHQTTTNQQAIFITITLYLIEILHQTTTAQLGKGSPCCCILLKFYIKPQLAMCASSLNAVVSYWNSTSNHNPFGGLLPGFSVVSYWNSTSNHNVLLGNLACIQVVSYWNSTSNHNVWLAKATHKRVVSYWNSTSNHNLIGNYATVPSLYLIEILHQTTTEKAG